MGPRAQKKTLRQHDFRPTVQTDFWAWRKKPSWTNQNGLMGACHRPYLFKIACFTTLFHWFEPKIVLSTLKRPLKKVPFFSHHPLGPDINYFLKDIFSESDRSRCRTRVHVVSFHDLTSTISLALYPSCKWALCQRLSWYHPQ